MVSGWKGHNYGPNLCKKCGKNHGPNPFKGKKHSVESRLKISVAVTRAFQNPEIRYKCSWNRGLTKETDERVRRQAKQKSKTFKALYKSGKVVWNKGLTKYTDERVRKIGETGSKTKQTPEYHEKQSKSIKMFYVQHPEKHPNRILARKTKIQLTYIEQLMKKILDSANVKNYPQHPIVYKKGKRYAVKFVDFYLPNHKLCIECDGEEWHKDKEADKRRDEIILSVLGNDWRIEHILGKEIFEFAKFFGFRK